MPIMSHIVELRHRILVIMLTITVVSLTLYFFTDQLLAVLLWPISEVMPADKLTVFGPFEPFSFRFKVALLAAIVIAAPIWIYQVLAFFVPALTPREQRWFFPTFAAMLFLFLGGIAFCYFVIMDPAFTWMIGQGGDLVAVIPGAQQFLTAISLLLLAFGVAFQLPLVVFYLIALGVVPYSTFRRNWRYAYTGLVVFAAGATPDFSPWTMGALSIALIGLYEFSLLSARLLFRKRIQDQALAESAEDAELARLEA